MLSVMQAERTHLHWVNDALIFRALKNWLPGLQIKGGLRVCCPGYTVKWGTGWLLRVEISYTKLYWHLGYNSTRQNLEIFTVNLQSFKIAMDLLYLLLFLFCFFTSIWPSLIGVSLKMYRLQSSLGSNMVCMNVHLKGLVHPKIMTLLLITHPHVVTIP